MENHVILAVFTLAAATMAPAASAQFYVGVGVGGAKATDIVGSGVASGVPYTVGGGDTTKTSWKVLGGYQFTPTWGVEAQYSDLGKRGATIAFGAPINASGTTNDATSSQWSIAGTGTVPLENNYYLIGKLGVSRNQIDNVNVTIAGVTASTDSSGKTDVLAGLGLGYKSNKNFGLRLEYEYFGKFSSSTGNGGGNNVKGSDVALSVLYAF